MNRKRYLNITNCFLLLSLLFGCTTQPGNKVEQISVKGACIPSSFATYYPTIVSSEFQFPQNVTPLSPWQLISSIENTNSSRINKLSFFNSTDNKIWGYQTSEQGETFLARYNVKENSWNVNDRGFKNTKSKKFSGMYLSNDKVSIWAIGQDPLSVYLYNTKEQVFEPIVDLSSQRGLVYYDKFKELFWLFSIDNKIYSVNPKTFEINFHSITPSLPILDTSVAISDKGQIYFVAWSKSEPRTVLYRFDPATNDLSEISNNTVRDFGIFFSLFIDSSGNLWVENKGFLSPNGVWNVILPSDVFIGETASGIDDPKFKLVTYDTADIVFESSDGRLWFRSINGMVWLDKKTNQWCKFSTYGLYQEISILEDVNRNLWMIADDELYKLSNP